MRTRPLTPPLLALPFLAIACGGCAARTSVTAQAPSTTANGSIQRSKDAHDTDVADAKDTPPDQWLALLDVVIESPVRRTVKPAGLPDGADEHLLAAARKASGYVPELARLMGIPIPPPPGPRRPVPARSSQSRRSG